MPDKSKSINVNVAVNEHNNRLLTASAKKNGRAKLREAEARLAHHLNVFGADWAQMKVPK
ncbi:TraY domain-containing protein [Vibrio scophthalmi]|uniref:Relaxosome protein TraY n=1 Tax=Vibrio scophthalmi LMG 19158 TaxID=870967 RepID=F9RNA9_9VIBR|nr:TraY domain-containing protein [Vibrio scophthalmi]EGU37254.1 hypothetical protein VIS19158_03567 [Vibrio scophthalmi LMG 19158]